MRLLARITQATHAKRLSRRWLVAIAITAAVAVMAPGISHATASQSGASQTSAALTSCRGVTPATLAARGFITNPARTQAGHLWWHRTASGSVCVGTVVEYVQYNATAAKTWRVIIYSAAHPDGKTIASRTFTLRRGWYFWSFRIRQAYPGLTAVCLAASESFGASCVHLG